MILAAMGEGVSGFALQVAALLVGGGTIQLVIALIRRKGELKALDRTSAAPLLDSAGALVDRLAAQEVKALGRVTELEERISKMTLDFAEKTNQSIVERRRLGAELAAVRSDLDIAKAQIEGLRNELRGLYRSRAADE